MSGLTLQQLRDASQARANMQQTSFITDSEWNEYVNEAACELHDLILQSDPKSIIVRESISLVTNQQFYDLPDDFYKVEAVYRLVGNVRYGIDRIDYHGIGQGLAVLANVVVGGSPYSYALVGSQIYFIPTPSGSNSVELWYFPSFSRLVNDSDTLNYPVINGWEQFVIITSVIKAKGKDGNMNIQSEMAQKSELKDRIILMANKRDEWEPPKFSDIYGATARQRRYNSYNPYQNLAYRWYR